MDLRRRAGSSSTSRAANLAGGTALVVAAVRGASAHVGSVSSILVAAILVSADVGTVGVVDASARLGRGADHLLRVVRVVHRGVSTGLVLSIVAITSL